MRLVNSYLSKNAIKKDEIATIHKYFNEIYSEKVEVSNYKFNDRVYYETDFDVIDIEFEKDKIYLEINKLITIHEKAMRLIKQEIDIIVANDDTDTEIQLFEKDQNNISEFGLFITTRRIANVMPYYTSDICNAYLNFEYVSFGVIFDGQ